MYTYVYLSDLETSNPKLKTTVVSSIDTQRHDIMTVKPVAAIVFKIYVAEKKYEKLACRVLIS